MNGVVLVNKEKGMTSHDVVAKMRRIYGTRRVGHTGTLDPMAEGLLPVCIGTATKAADMMTASDKRYRAVMELGKISDTLDAEGTVTEGGEVNVSEADIRNAAAGFVGEYDQLPPMYSAIKKNGKKLYELAREGIEIEREKRRVTIYKADVTDISLPYVTLDVCCSKGTYIRSLCSDIGADLGCGAVMTALVRTGTCGFSLEDAYTLGELESMEEPERVIIPTDSLFSDLPAIELNEKQERSIINGVRMTWRGGREGQSYRLYGRGGRFLCVSRLEDSRLVLVKSFWQNES